MSTSQLTRREYAYVHISGPGTHEAISETLGLKPSEAWNIGDINPRNGRPRKDMHWGLGGSLDDTHPIEEHIQSLVLFFRPNSAALRSLWVEYDITLQCVGHYPLNHGPGIHLDREVVRQAAQLAMAIDCDMYWVDDGGHESRA
jgi:hypothetical protein